MNHKIVGAQQLTPITRASKDHINIRILLAMVSGIPLTFGLGTRKLQPYVYVVIWPPTTCCPTAPLNFFDKEYIQTRRGVLGTRRPLGSIVVGAQRPYNHQDPTKPVVSGMPTVLGQSRAFGAPKAADF